MNWTPLYIIPGLSFLFWALVHTLLTSRTAWYRILLLLLLSVFFTAAGDLILGSALKSETVSQLFIQLFAPAIIPLTCLYFAHMYKEFKYRYVQMLWIVLPVMLFTASGLLVSINGLGATDAFLGRLHEGLTGDQLFYNSAEHAYYVWTVVIFRYVIGAEAVFMLGYCSYLGWKLHFRPRHIIDFLSSKRWRVRVLEILVMIAVLILLGLCLKIFLHYPFQAPSPGVITALVLFLAVLQFLFGFFALFSTREFISLTDIRTAFRFNYKPETASAMAEEVIMDMIGQLNGESIAHVLTRLEVQSGADPSRSGARVIQPSLSSAILGKTRKDDSLPARFQHLMTEEHLFLQPGLTLTDVAERLNTNKTYVSKMVNQTYSLGFPEVLNILRVDYAETYIRKHPEATQEDIAKACGFVSASSFNSTFKRITGYTPKVWAARNST